MGHSANTEVLLITLPFDPFKQSYEELKRLQPGLEVLHYNTNNVEDVPSEVWARATVLLTLRVCPRSRDQVPQLKWIHLYSGGVNQITDEPLLKDKSLIWTRNSGVHAPQIAEWVIATLLAYFRHIPTLLQWQRSASWNADRYVSRGDLLGKTMGLLGYGAIGRHTARIAAACGMRVIVFTLHEKSTPEQRRSTTFTPRGTGDPIGEIPAEWHHGDIDQFLNSHIDVLVVSMPSTTRTKNCLGKEQFARLKGCYLINVARGDIVQTPALIEALNNDTLRGAALDVTNPEPLPSDHPLWSTKNTIITPHISGISDEYMPRTVEILDENLGRLIAGKELMNLILREDGY